jgi:lysophospholipase L1-like esterase
MTQANSFKSDWKFKLGITFFSFIAALIIAEGMVRVLGVNDQFTRKIFSENLLQKSSDPVLMYEPKPGGRSDIDGVENLFSSQGLRDREFAVPKPPGVFRVIAIGDSVTYGLGVRAQESYPKVLEELLRNSGPEGVSGVEVLNMGVNGYKTLQEVEHLKVNGLKFDPDVVILGFNLNDPGDFSRELPYFNTWQDRKWNREGIPFWQNLRGWLTRHSDLAFMIEYRTLKMRMGKLVEKKKEEPAAKPEKRYDGYFQLYRNTAAMKGVSNAFASLEEMSKNHSFHVIFTVFPLFYDFQNYRWTDLHTQIISLGKEHHFTTLDLLEIYKGTGQPATVFQRRTDDLEHPNPLGHAIAAKALQDAIISAGFFPATQQTEQ